MIPAFRPAAAAVASCLALRGSFAAEEAAPQLAAPRAQAWIQKQDPWRLIPESFAKATPENARIVVHLATQRALLLAGAEVALETPISSGKRDAPTVPGNFFILEKLRNHQSSTYGSFVDKRGRTVRSGVSMKLDAAPAGTHYVADAMPFFFRFTETGFGIHGGTLPGYAAAHGSIRVPEEVARLLFEKVRVGTPVEIR